MKASRQAIDQQTWPEMLIALQEASEAVKRQKEPEARKHVAYVRPSIEGDLALDPQLR